MSAALPVAALAALAGCGGSLPPGVQVDGWRAPEVTDSSGTTLVVNHGPRVIMKATRATRDQPLHLLFVDGRGTTMLNDGGFGWADLSGSRGIVFDETGSVRTVLQGQPAGGPPPARPAFVLDGPDGWRLVETDGRILNFDGSAPSGWVEAKAPGVLAASRGGVDVYARTVLEFEQRPVRPGEPLLWAGGDSMGVAQIPSEPLLGQLHNAGWAVRLDDGMLAFAAATRPELQLFSHDGSSTRARFPVQQPVEDVRFQLVDGDVHPLFRAVIHGIALGPRGLLYILLDSDGENGAERVLAFTSSGEWVAQASIAPGATVGVADDGTLRTLDLAALLSRTPETDRRARFPDFAWPLLGSGDTLSSATIEEPVLVLNMWASWCAPCRRELPLLAEYAQSPEGEGVAVLGFNDDLRPAQAMAFLDQLGGPAFPSVSGRGDFKRTYGYRGLPYTVVLDQKRRVVGAVYGFGSTIDPVRELVRRAREPVGARQP